MLAAIGTQPHQMTVVLLALPTPVAREGFCLCQRDRLLEQCGIQVEVMEAPAMVAACAEAITANGRNERHGPIKDGRNFCLRFWPAARSTGFQSEKVVRAVPFVTR
jgi:hypothetical protein